MSGYCSHCGTALGSGAAFCTACGKPAHRAATSTQVPPSPYPPASTVPPHVAPSYAPQRYAAPYGYPNQPQRPAWEWMLLPLQRYADFSGRSQRQEYWMFFLLGCIVSSVCILLIIAGFPWSDLQYESDPSPGPLFFVGFALLILWWLATIIPTIAVAVRRFHDQNQSGWMYLLSLIPYVGGIILIVFMCIDGTPGPNQYGPDPKARGIDDIFA